MEMSSFWTLNMLCGKRSFQTQMLRGWGETSFFNSLKFQKHTIKNSSYGELRKDLNIFEEDVAAEEPKELEEIKEF